MSSSFHPEAEEEFINAMDYYENIETTLTPQQPFSHQSGQSASDK